MPETGSQILQYEGSPQLGVGANANIPVYNPNSNLDVINDAAKNIDLLNHEDNIRLYNQKIQDRDATLNLLQQGQIASGDINQGDRPYYETARDNVKSAFDEMMNKGGINNEDAYRNYLSKVADLKNVTTNAQSRNIELAKLQQERSQQTLPEDIKAYDNHIKQQQQKSFWQPIDPFQKAFNYDLNSSTSRVTGQPTTLGQIGTDVTGGQPTAQTTWQSRTMKNGVETDKTTTKNAPAKTGVVNNKTAKQPITISGTQVNPDGSISPYSYTPEQYYDFPTIQKNVDELAATDPTERYTYQSFLNDFTNDQKLPPDQQMSTLKAYNNRIADYSTQRGIAPIGQNPDGTPKYPDQIKYYQDPVSGKVLIQETPASFFAKHALASINGDYVQKPQRVTDLKTAEYNLKANESKAKIGALKALESERYARSNLTYKKSKALDQQFNPQQVFNELGGKLESFPVKSGNIITRVNADNISQELKNDLGINPLTGNNGKDKFYNIQPTNITFTSNSGKKTSMSEDDAGQAYKNWLTNPKYVDQVNKIKESKGGQTPTMLDFLYANNANFNVDAVGLSKQEKNKQGIITNKGGEITRSNRLQTYINQLNKGGVKGKELVQLLSEDNSDSGTQDENTPDNTNNQ